MLVTTKGIVLHTLKYSDSSIIVKIYTEVLGIQSFLLNGIRSSKSKIKIGLFQPLSLLDLVVDHKNNVGLQRIKDVKIAQPLYSIYSNFSKNAIAFFISEVLYKSLKEETPNQHLFDFLRHSILFLEVEEKDFLNFHLHFLAEYTEYLGFYPQIPTTFTPSFFDLKLGGFTKTEPNHSFFLSKEYSKLLYHLFISSQTHSKTITLSSIERRVLIQAFINYYELHLTSFHSIKSHQVLEQLAR